jgi:hypothetical protein
MATLCAFQRGTTATLYANFIELDGEANDPPDPKIAIFFKDTEVLAPTALTKIKKGFYFFDWSVPSDAAVGAYSTVYTGDIEAIDVQGIGEIFVQLGPADAGGGISDGMLDLPVCDVTSISSRMSDLIGAVFYYIKEAQTIPIYNEEAIMLQDDSIARGTFPFWNSLALRSPIVRKNNEVITTGYTVNFADGWIEFDKPVLESDTVTLSYNFRCFEDCELAEFIEDAVKDLNIIPPATQLTVDGLPTDWESTVIYGAVAHALRRLIFKLNFQEKAIIFGGREGANQAIGNFNTLLTTYSAMWDAQKEKTKRGKWPSPSSIVVPEFTLPGGRSRWFRYLYK